VAARTAQKQGTRSPADPTRPGVSDNVKDAIEAKRRQQETVANLQKVDHIVVLMMENRSRVG
jgi:phospholipase C